MKLIITLILLLTLNSFSQSKYELKAGKDILDCSEQVLRLLANQEINERDNPDIVFNIIKTAGGNSFNTAWCSALQYYAFYTCNGYDNSFVIPINKTLVANNVFNYAVSTGKRVRYEAKKNDLIVWKKQNSWQGHIERVIEVKGNNRVITIGGNTTKDNSNEHNGGGVYYKQRNIVAPLSRILLVRGLIGFKNDN